MGTVLGKCQLSLSCLPEVLEAEAASGGGSGRRKEIGNPCSFPGPAPRPPCQHSPLVSFLVRVVNCP